MSDLVCRPDDGESRQGVQAVLALGSSIEPVSNEIRNVMSGEVGVYKPTLLDVSVSLHELRGNSRAIRQPIRVGNAVTVFPLR